MCEFRETINESQRERTKGMHYAHYTTIIQVLHLLAEKWRALSEHYQNCDKCILVVSQILGYLKLVGLPAMERFAFARDFHNKELSAAGRYEPNRRVQDFDFSNLVRTGEGGGGGNNWGHVWLALAGPSPYGPGRGSPWPTAARLLNHMLSKNSTLLDLMHTPQPTEVPRSRCVLL